MLKPKKIDFKIDSIIYLKFQELLSTAPMNSDTQLEIEKFLINQGSILLENKKKRTKNYKLFIIKSYCFK